MLNKWKKKKKRSNKLVGVWHRGRNERKRQKEMTKKIKDRKRYN